MKGGDRGGLGRTDFEEVIGRGVVAELILGAVFFSGCWLSRYDSGMGGAWAPYLFSQQSSRAYKALIDYPFCPGTN